MRNRILDLNPLSEEPSDIDRAVSHHDVALEYKDLLHFNEESDQIDGTAFELRDFADRFKNSEENKKFELKKRKNKNHVIPECTLLEIFKYLYKGYSNKQIARIYGVTDMSITHLKHKLAEAMLEYGFGPRSRLQECGLSLIEK
jgi:DNA-directed RNA polymerase specialized sigma subunit